MWPLPRAQIILKASDLWPRRMPTSMADSITEKKRQIAEKADQRPGCNVAGATTSG